jgi:hypothetical protein
VTKIVLHNNSLEKLCSNIANIYYKTFIQNEESDDENIDDCYYDKKYNDSIKVESINVEGYYVPAYHVTPSCY